MSNQKLFPPRRVYSLEEAAMDLGCSVEAILDWGNQGLVEICMKMSTRSKLSLPYDPFLSEYIEKDDENHYRALVEVEISSSLIEHIETDEAIAILKPLPSESIMNDLWAFKEGKKRWVLWPGNIYGLWVLRRGDLFNLDFSGENKISRIRIHPYSSNNLFALVDAAFFVRDLFLPAKEFELLKNYKGGKTLFEITLNSLMTEGQLNRGRPSGAWENTESTKYAFDVAKLTREKHPDAGLNAISGKLTDLLEKKGMESTGRATIYNYLISKGMEPSRTTKKWDGELVTPN